MLLMRPRTALQVIIFLQAYCNTEEDYPHYIPMFYPDYDQDYYLYFDRMVSLNYQRPGEPVYNIGTGVFITSDRLLTSYNPIRGYIFDPHMLQYIVSSVIIGRVRRKYTFFNRYGNDTYHFYRSAAYIKDRGLACGRQVQYLPDVKITARNLWHGLDRRNCPLHDLMVIRIVGEHKVSPYAIGDITVRDLSYDEYDIVTDVYLTELAGPGDQMGAAFKYCELVNGQQLEVVSFQPSDNAEVDCDMFLLREWGRFICILDKTNRRQVTSGAMLVSNDMLFGVGSFALTKHNTNILVFTDVRPYKDNIFQACTFEDSRNRYYVPKKFPKKHKLDWGMPRRPKT